MPTTTLFHAGAHRNLLVEAFDTGSAIPCNQHLIVHGDQAMILDPGGTRMYRPVKERLEEILDGATITQVFLSHQDPDIVGAANWWMLSNPRAVGWIAEVWRRFVPHLGEDPILYDRLRGIPDEGTWLTLGDAELMVLPAHYLHSAGNYHVYDPVSRILYSGDLGSSSCTRPEVTDLSEVIPNMEPFHRRYMASNAAMRLWVRMVRQLDVQILAPQHGSTLRGPEIVGAFLDWCEQLDVGVDHRPDLYALPPRPE